MTAPAVVKHALIPTTYPGSTFEPEQTCYGCACGVAFDAFEEQGRGVSDVDAEYAAHIEGVAA